MRTENKKKKNKNLTVKWWWHPKNIVGIVIQFIG